MKRKRLWTSFVLFILLCLITEILGGLWTRQTIATWYPSLVKPSWTPPNWVFGPVWSCLYIMIGISGWLIYRSPPSSKRSTALVFYGSQLAVNFIWSFLFFSLQSPILGLIDIAILCLLIAFSMIKFWPINRLASILLTPYFGWVLYATTLNAGIWIFNA